MFCTSCGREIDDDSKFCSFCGEHVVGIDKGEEGQTNGGRADDAAARAAATAASTYGANAAEGAAAIADEKPGPSPKRSKKVLIGVVAALCVVAIGVGAFLWWQNDQAYKAAHEPVSIEIVLRDSSVPRTTAIPIRVRGNDLDGKSVDEVQVVHPGEGVSVLRGQYDLKLESYPASTDGAVYRYSDNVVSVQVDESGAHRGEASKGNRSSSQASASNAVSASSQASSSSSSASFDIEVVPAEQVTDEMVGEIEKWQRDAGIANGEIEKTIKQVTDNRQQELDRIAAEEAKRIAEEEARRAAEEARMAARSETAQGFARQYYTNMVLPDESNPSQVQSISNWADLVRDYLAPGSEALSEFNSMVQSSPFKGLSAGCLAVDSGFVSDDGTTIVVTVTYKATQDPKSNWYSNPGHTSTFTCTLDESNQVTSYSIAN